MTPNRPTPLTTESTKRRTGRPPGGSPGATREKLLNAAEEQFATHGFAGVTIRDVGEALNLTTAAVVHHFGSKEKLYSAVLERIAESISRVLPNPSTTGDVAVLNEIFERLFDWTVRNPLSTQLVMRELMDNRARAKRARRWHLRPMMDAYVGIIKRGQAASTLPRFDAELFVYFFTGAITHFAIAAFSIRHMYEMPDERDLLHRFRGLQGELITAAMKGLQPPPKR